MPRPKKEGAPEPKKRSRNGCWPCKSKKIKCGEEKDECLNCQRQGETCDYSIRLNWEGRGKKKHHGPEGTGLISFSNSTISIPERSRGPSTTTFDIQPQRRLSPTNLFQEPAIPDQSSSFTPNYQFSGRRPSSIEPASMLEETSPGRGYSQRYELCPPAPSRSGMHRSSAQELRQGFVHGTLPSPVDSGIGSPMNPSTSAYNQAMNAPTPPMFTGKSEDEGLADSNSPGPSMKRARHDFPSERGRSSRNYGMAPPYGVPVFSYGAHMTSSVPGHGESADPRRLSVESLLSGPAGMGSDASSYNRGSISDTLSSISEVDPSASAEVRGSISDIVLSDSFGSVYERPDELATWGTDRGFKDLDLDRNDDRNATSGGSPTVSRRRLDLVLSDDDRSHPAEFGFGVQAKEIAFEGGGYYARPVPIKLPRSFEPLPNILLQNPMNLLYFHHFISHTARILVPHHCSSNPFQNLLPRMALRDPNLMNLLLAYSASHRAQLLQHTEPATRIALWVQDIFPNLRHSLNDPSRLVSNSTLATAVMLASLEIMSPKAFGVAVPWRQHLDIAKQVIAARRTSRSKYRDLCEVSKFLLRWFAYLDLIGSLIGGSTDSPSTTGTSLLFIEEDHHDIYQIDCLWGFTGRCGTLLARIADLARTCAASRVGLGHIVKPDWQPLDDIRARAERLIVDLEDSLANTSVRPCQHSHPVGEATEQWDNREMQAVNEAYHWAGMVHVHRRILGRSSSHPDVQNGVREILGALYAIRKGSSAEACLLFPMFTAGCDAQNEKQKALVMDRFKEVEGFGMTQARKARNLMQRVWETGKPWESLVSGEFVG